jgi:hypothetical protein
MRAWNFGWRRTRLPTSLAVVDAVISGSWNVAVTPSENPQ